MCVSTIREISIVAVLDPNILNPYVLLDPSISNVISLVITGISVFLSFIVSWYFYRSYRFSGFGYLLGLPTGFTFLGLSFVFEYFSLIYRINDLLYPELFWIQLILQSEALSLIAISYRFKDHYYKNHAALEDKEEEEGRLDICPTNKYSFYASSIKKSGTSLASDTLAGRTSSNASEIWVLGSDWEFGVAKGSLTNLVVDIKMSKIDGKGAHHHTIESLRNTASAALPDTSELIALKTGNYTDFKGIVDITTNGQVKWKDVPIVVHVLNGNTINFNIEPTKTDDHFKGLRVFGTVESIVDQNGKELTLTQ